MNSEVFEDLPPTKLILRCAVPSMVTMVFGALYSMADGLFVGRFIGQDALAAVNLIMPVITIVFAFSNMIATGSSVQISILLGRKDREGASRVFSFSIKVILLLSCLFGLLGYWEAEPFIRLISPGADENAIQYGVEYLRVYAVFAPLLLVFFATDNYLRVCGKETVSMWIGIVSQLANVVLDAVLIAGLGMGIRAAAATSCVSIAVGSIVTLFLFAGDQMDLYYTGKNIPLKNFLRILANGSSEFFSNIASSVMSVILNLFLLKHGGTVAVAAFSVVMYVDSIVGMLTFGLCDALQPAISYCYGAGLMEKVKAIFKRILLCSMFFSLCSMLFMLSVGQYVAPLFVKPEDTELLKLSISAMKIFAFSYLAGWMDTCFSAYFTALERPARSFIASLFGTLIFPVLFLFALSEIWGLNGVWLMPTIAGFASGILVLILAATLKLS